MTTSLAFQLFQFQSQLVRYETPFILVFGTVTNIFNIMIFSRSNLRKNICSWYFVCLSLSNLLLLLMICAPLIVGIWANYNPTAYDLSYCKIRQYSFDLLMCLSRHFLCLIAIDRWLVTSSDAGLRQWSSPRIARRLITGSVLFWAVFNIHSLIGYNITGNLCTPPLTSTYFLFYCIYSIIISLLPMIIMTLFSILTLRSIRSRRVVPFHPLQMAPSLINNTVTTAPTAGQASQKPRSHRDIHLIRLSIIQVVAFLIFNSGWSVYPLYLFVVSTRGFRSTDERILSAFLVGIGFNLLFTYAALTFVLYTMGSAQFRRECITGMKNLLNMAQRRLQMFN